MPILLPEPIVFPDDLLTSPDSRPGSDARWWALHTKPRVEKSLVRRLRARQVAYFLPLYKHSWRRGGRNQTSHLPLFPSYVFLFGDAAARLSALETNMLVRVLPVPDQARLHADLTRVYRLLTGDVPLTPEDGFRPGARVVITSGPFEGLEGKLLRGDGKTRLVVEVSFLRQGVSLEIEPWMVRPADEDNEDSPVGEPEPALAG